MGIAELELLISLGVAYILASGAAAIGLVFWMCLFDFWGPFRVLVWKKGFRLVSDSRDSGEVIRRIGRQLTVSAIIFVASLFLTLALVTEIDLRETELHNELIHCGVVKVKLSDLQCWEVQQFGSSDVSIVCFGSAGGSTARSITIDSLLSNGN